MRAVGAARGDKVGCRRRVARVGVGVELAEPARASLIELRVHGDALQAALVALRLHGYVPLRVVDVAEYGTKRLLVHDAHAPNPEVAFALSRLADPTSLRTTAIGVYRDVHRATYDDLLHEQLAAAADEEGSGDRDMLEQLIAGTDTWTVDGTVDETADATVNETADA